jgi:hypothetical protein
MIITGNDHRNAAVTMDLLEFKVLMEICRQVSKGTMEDVAKSLKKDGFNLTPEELASFPTQAAIVSSFLLATVHLHPDKDDDDDEDETQATPTPKPRLM